MPQLDYGVIPFFPQSEKYGKTTAQVMLRRHLQRGESSFVSHCDPAMVEWFVRMVEERKNNHDSAKEKKNW